MAKCPKCERKKGKRFCPALDTMICATCCGTHRLQTIACPQDCEHLQKEYYQLHRRESRARSHGKALIAAVEDLFYSSESKEFGFMVQADAYWWLKDRDPPTNEELAATLEAVASRLSDVAVPGSANPLVEFLVELLTSSPRYLQHAEKGFDHGHRRNALDTLRRHIQSHGKHASGIDAPAGDAATHSYWHELADYFGELDFEADLDYSPAEELEQAASGGNQPRAREDGFEERQSGLVVPRE
jgi:hypothetical protein